MNKFLMKLMLLIIAGIIYLITGRNRRQKEKIPDGMDILCDPPEQRYLVYAMGIFVFLSVMVISVLYIRAGAPKEARMMWGLCVVMAVGILAVTIFSGNMMAKMCVYFNSELLYIERPFHETRVFKWYEIQKIEGKYGSTIHLYHLDGTKILTVYAKMVNYKHFCEVLQNR